MPVTIKDVAALAGVSPSTVSRTCKDHPSISRQTKEKVRQAMAKLGYEPNFQASSLATQNSRTVGIILPPSEWEAYQNPFYLEMIRGISQYCNQKQYINTVITGQNEDEILQAIKTMARTGLAEGFIVLYSREQDPVLDYLYEEGLLYVLIGKACRNVNQTIYVDNDNVLAGREAAEYLLNLGHVRIACLSGDHSLLYNHDRKWGICWPWQSGVFLLTASCVWRCLLCRRSRTRPWRPCSQGRTDPRPYWSAMTYWQWPWRRHVLVWGCPYRGMYPSCPLTIPFSPDSPFRP